MLACPASFFKKDSRQAGMTDNVALLMNSLVTYDFSLVFFGAGVAQW